VAVEAEKDQFWNQQPESSKRCELARPVPRQAAPVDQIEAGCCLLRWRPPISEKLSRAVEDCE
jgi:hypothetical protein